MSGDIPIVELTGARSRPRPATGRRRGCDTTLAVDTPAFREVGHLTAEILFAAGGVRDNLDRVVKQANDALRDLLVH
jgi:hypothetical protein